MRNISKKAIDLIVRYEVTSKAVYEKKYTRPEWPGVKSGVTVGIGYDVGYQSPTTIQKDWEGHIPQKMIDALKSVAGINGAAAESATASVRNKVNVPWDAAIKVFENTVLPRWINNVTKALPNTDKISDDCLGALVSLCYNRGTSFNLKADRYLEMRNIKALMARKEFEKIPQEFRNMKRIWPGVSGLIKRREDEAKLFEEGLKNSTITSSTGPIIIAGGTVVAGGAAVATQTSDVPMLIAVIAGTFIAGLVFWIIVRSAQKKEEIKRYVEQNKTKGK